MMSNSHILDETVSAQAGTTPAPADRRREGRPAEVSPALLPLLRRELLHAELPPQPELDWPEDEIDPDSLGAVRGIMFSVAISLPVWAAIGAGIYYGME